MAFARFASVSAEQIEQIVEDKDSENTKTSTKVSKHAFLEYLSEKKLEEPTKPAALAKCLSTFYVEARKKDGSAEESGSMYETGGPFCPVASFEKYLQHSNPKNEFLFLRPKKEVNHEIWYDNMVVGERILANKMKEISTEAKLSHIYTNHSIRGTSITLLDKAGFEARHIMTVSGHRNESSIRSYSKTDKKTKKRMSRQLTAFARDVAR